VGKSLYADIEKKIADTNSDEIAAAATVEMRFTGSTEEHPLGSGVSGPASRILVGILHMAPGTGMMIGSTCTWIEVQYTIPIN
jgi:hypothetical protein